jgi:hypothetical protein
MVRDDLEELSDEEFLGGRKVLGLDGVAEILEKEIELLSSKLRNGRQYCYPIGHYINKI